MENIKDSHKKIDFIDKVATYVALFASCLYTLLMIANLYLNNYNIAMLYGSLIVWSAVYIMNLKHLKKERDLSYTALKGWGSAIDLLKDVETELDKLDNIIKQINNK